MSQPYVGEIRMFAGNFAPNGWAFCDGTLVAIAENDVLFNLIGTTYGGDGQNTFALPDLRGRVPLHQGQSAGTSNYVLAQSGGVETVTLTNAQLPGHSHSLRATATTADSPDLSGKTLATASTFNPYIAANPAVPMAAQSIGAFGGSQPHDNLQPYLCINFIISLFGVYPTQT